MVPMPLLAKFIADFNDSFIVSPPQNCLKMVAFTNPFTGRCSAKAALVKLLPNLVSHGVPITVKSHFAFQRSASDLEAKAIAVLPRSGSFRSTTEGAAEEEGGMVRGSFVSLTNTELAQK